MFKREDRLGPFSLKNSKTYSSKLFNVRFAKNDLEKNRFAFVVSKKVDSSAVARNRIRRRLRAIIEAKSDKMKLGFDFIFYPKAVIQDLAKEDLEMEIESFLEKQTFLKQ